MRIARGAETAGRFARCDRAIVPGRSTDRAWGWEGISALDKALVLERMLDRPAGIQG